MAEAAAIEDADTLAKDEKSDEKNIPEWLTRSRAEAIRRALAVIAQIREKAGDIIVWKNRGWASAQRVEQKRAVRQHKRALALGYSNIWERYEHDAEYRSSMQQIERNEDDIKYMSEQGKLEHDEPSERKKLNIPWQMRDQQYGHYFDQGAAAARFTAGREAGTHVRRDYYQTPQQRDEQRRQSRWTDAQWSEWQEARRNWAPSKWQKK